ncbi:anti-sigma factor [Lysobacter sp. cf310]|uniref:anti-sigma factor n=1 Tax=Lysobacter sp. cf310 TaxID=1761790 RepID=UPI0008F05700|nr:anti-sigma factor [Lysobacter sp. cf310]SFK30284.1 Anti-sigma-K factor RskA [Lysobacter sp. cf310]
MSAQDPRFDDETGPEPPDSDVHAGEYVLGVLDAQQRRQAQARIAADPEFARAVADWERRLATLLDEIAPVDVPAHLWPRLRTHLGLSPVGEQPRGVWQNLGFWRAATAVAAAAALAALFVGRVPQTPTPTPPATPPIAVEPAEQAKPVTTLAHDDGSPGWLASLDIKQGKVLMVPVPAPADAQGRVPELWLIPAGEAPRSLGLVSIDKAHTVAVPKDLLRALKPGSTLAITLEPAGGAPRGIPTGPIVAKGGLQTI